jgi:hypothetical protein
MKLKNLLLAVLLLFSISGISQSTTFECLQCSSDKPVDVPDNGIAPVPVYVTGLYVKVAGGSNYVVTEPYTYWFRGSRVYLRGADGAEYSIRKSDTPYPTTVAMREFLASCKCPSYEIDYVAIQDSLNYARLRDSLPTNNIYTNDDTLKAGGTTITSNVSNPLIFDDYGKGSMTVVLDVDNAGAFPLPSGGDEGVIGLYMTNLIGSETAFMGLNDGDRLQLSASRDIILATNSSLVLETAGTNRLTINNSGAISLSEYGVGSFNQPLDFVLGVDNTGAIKERTYADLKTDLGIGAFLWESDANGITTVGLPNVGIGGPSSAFSKFTVTGSSGFFGPAEIIDNAGLTIYNSNFDQVFVTDGTNREIGINTSPAYALDVFDTDFVVARFTSSQVAGSYMSILSAATGSNPLADGFLFGVGPGGSAEIWNKENAALNIYTNNTRHLTIANTGVLSAPAYTENNIPFFGAGGLIDEDTMFKFDEPMKQLKIGDYANSAVSPLDGNTAFQGLSITGTYPELWSTAFNDAQYGSTHRYAKARGTSTAPTDVQNGDQIYAVRAIPFVNGAWGAGAYLSPAVNLDMLADNVMDGATAYSGKFSFSTVKWDTFNVKTGSSTFELGTEKLQIFADSDTIMTQDFSDQSTKFHGPIEQQIDALNTTMNWELAARRSVTAFPAPYFRPLTTDKEIGFDVMPNGTPVENGNNGFAWIDVIDKDASASQPSMNAARVGMRSTAANFSSRSFNGASAKPIWMDIDGVNALEIDTSLKVSLPSYTENNIPYFGANGLIQEQTTAGHSFTYDGATLRKTANDLNGWSISENLFQTHAAGTTLQDFEMMTSRGTMTTRLPSNVGDGAGEFSFSFRNNDNAWSRSNSGFMSLVEDTASVSASSNLIFWSGKSNNNFGIPTDPLDYTMTLNGDKTVSLNQYGSGVNTGTPTYNLEVDANGNIIETATGGGGGGSIGGSITDNQIAVGALTANEIEGDAAFTYDATSDLVTLGDNTGSTEIRLSKLETGTSKISFYNAGVEEGYIEQASTEDFNISALSVGYLRVNGSNNFRWQSGLFGGNLSTSAAVLNESGSLTNPTLIPNRATTSTGVGGTGSSLQVALISNSKPALVTSNAGTVTNVEIGGAVQDFGGTIAGQGVLRLNDVTTVPTGILASGGLLYVTGTDIRFLDDAGTDSSLLGGSNYANAALTADASYNHTWGTFNQTETYTTGDFTIANTGNANALFIDGATGRVGINDSAPSYPLDVNGQMGIQGYIFHNNDSNTYTNFQTDGYEIHCGNKRALTVDEVASGSTYRVSPNNEYDFSVGSYLSPTLYVGGSDNIYTDLVGIGTNTPAEKLHLYDALDATLLIEGAVANGATLALKETSDTEYTFTAGASSMTFRRAGTLTMDFIDNGDVKFYNDLGTVAGLNWDASTARLAVGQVVPNSSLEVWGNLGFKIVTIGSTTYSADSEYCILANDDTAGGIITITLPAASTLDGRIYVIKKIGNTANVVIDGNGAETIDGALTATLTTQWESITVQCNGTAWFIH